MEDARSRLIRKIGADLNEMLVKATEKHDLTTREQFALLSMLFGGVVAMSHIPEPQARQYGQDVIDFGLQAVRQFQRTTHS